MTPYDLGAQSKADVFKMLLIFFRKKKNMASALNMSHEKLPDFVSFPLLGFILVIKLRKSPVWLYVASISRDSVIQCFHWSVGKTWNRKKNLSFYSPMLCRAVKISPNMQKRVVFQVKTLATNNNRERVHPAVFHNLTSSPTHILTQTRKHTHMHHDHHKYPTQLLLQ